MPIKKFLKPPQQPLDERLVKAYDLIVETLFDAEKVLSKQILVDLETTNKRLQNANNLLKIEKAKLNEEVDRLQSELNKMKVELKQSTNIIKEMQQFDAQENAL
jgi:gamma-glutamyl phosphate reductase